MKEKTERRIAYSVVGIFGAIIYWLSKVPPDGWTFKRRDQ